MPTRKKIDELDSSIERLRAAIEALRAGSAGPAEMDRALSELARMKAERLRLMLHKVNFSTERRLRRPSAAGAPKDRKPSAPPADNADG